MNLSALFPSWLAHIPFGWIVFVLLVLILTIDAMRSGSVHASVLAITAPVSLFFFDLISHTVVVGNLITAITIPYVMAGLFLALFVVVFLLVNRMTASFAGASGGLFFSFLSGLSGTIAVMLLWLQIPALMTLWNPGSQIHAIFGLPYALLWFLGIYVVLAFVRS